MPGCSLSSCDDSWDGLQPTPLTLSAGVSGSRWWVGECNCVSSVYGHSWSLGLLRADIATCCVFIFPDNCCVFYLLFTPRQLEWERATPQPVVQEKLWWKIGRWIILHVSNGIALISNVQWTDLFVYLHSMSRERNTKMWGESFPLPRTSFCSGATTNRTLHQNICPAVVVGSAHNSTLVTVFKGNATGARLQSRSAAGESCACVCWREDAVTLTELPWHLPLTLCSQWKLKKTKFPCWKAAVGMTVEVCFKLWTHESTAHPKWVNVWNSGHFCIL